MGSWNGRCGLTGLPIFYEEDVMLLILRKNYTERIGCTTNPYAAYTPICFPAEGKYDDYGCVGNMKNEEEVLKDLNRFDFYIADKIDYESINDENCINLNQADILFPGRIVQKLYTYKPYEIKDLESFQKDILHNHICIDDYGQKFQITTWMCHLGIYQKLIESVKSHKYFADEEPFYECTINNIRKKILETQMLIERKKEKLKSRGDKWDNEDLSDYVKDNLKLSSYNNRSFDPTDDYMLTMIIDNNEDYLEQIAEYLCFMEALYVLHKGFYTEVGYGQAPEFYLYKIVAEWVTNYIADTEDRR